MMKLFNTTKKLGKAVALIAIISAPHISMAQIRYDYFQYASLGDLLVYKDGSGKSQAAAQAQSRYGGKVLSVSTSKRDGRTVYKVKLLLDSGRIKIVSINGR